MKLVFLPPYAFNLNLIERYWKFFKKKILYGR
ncbi:transposase [Nitrosomonas sp. Nm58]